MGKKVIVGMNESGEGGESRSQVTQDSVPGGDVKLEGEDDVISVAYLTNEAALSAEVAVEHVVGGILQQVDQVGCVFALGYLKKINIHILRCLKVADDWCNYIINTGGYLSQVHDTVQMARLQQVRPLLHSGR